MTIRLLELLLHQLLMAILEFNFIRLNIILNTQIYSRIYYYLPFDPPFHLSLHFSGFRIICDIVIPYKYRR